MYMATQEAAKTALSCSSDRSLRVPCFCEENVWRLAYRRLHLVEKVDNVVSSHDMEYYVIFISNDDRCCPLFCQLAKEDEDDPCYWDYHVILVGTKSAKTKDGSNEIQTSVVFDMDSHLSFPCSFGTYLSRVFRPDCFRQEYRRQLAPRFRVIKAEMYLKHFYSDRQHMIDPNTGKWLATPPQYACIMAPGAEGKKETVAKSTTGIDSSERLRCSNLDGYIDMNSTDKPYLGVVYTIDELKERFC